jgi:hypothetical protein
MPDDLKDGPEAANLRNLVVFTINGIAAGLRNFAIIVIQQMLYNNS